MTELNFFQNQHQNASIVVCGCGESLNDLAQPERFITIGVNDVGRRFQPRYLVVVNPRSQFSGDRFKYVETSQAEYLFTQLELGVKHPNVVKFKLGQFGGTDFSNPNVLHYTNNSPYIALCLAILMGARRIGLIGVDFTDHHFFARTGRHPLAAQFDSINEQYRRLAEAAQARGVEIFNLSKISRLTAFPKISVNEFEEISKPETAEKLDIVSYATTPVAGVPAILARCIAAQTAHSARCVWATNDYGNGVSFAGDVEWNKRPKEASNLLSEADLVIVHNGKIAPEHERFFKDKAVVTMAHNYLWNVDQRFVKKGLAGVVVGQYQAVLDEFQDWSVVPNPIPFWEADYQPAEKSDRITICYTPSGKHEKYPPDHKLYWHSKGYETTVRILEKLAARFSVNLEMIGSRQISHTESLTMKRRSHIVIDECVTGSYHRNSLEGLAAGAVVVNGLGILPRVAEVLRFCADDSAENPFVPATLENLEAVLTDLIETGRENLLQKGAENRAWLEKNWDFARQWHKFWFPAIGKSFEKVNRKFVSRVNKSNDDSIREVAVNMELKEFKQGVSVVVPHGGRNRLPHLRSCLANLRQCEAVGEIIVVEMDEFATAEMIARKWADKYVFLKKREFFERARALNVGSAFAECEFVLWLDNDLLVAPDFISRAVAELRQRKLDFLKPYSAVKYLSLADSEKVMQGTLNPDECALANVYYSTTTDGGAGLVRREFLAKYGGIPAGFRGWGGEDNGWMHKVSLLGKGGRTNAADRTVFHLYHALSGGYGGSLHYESNPHYQTNLALLGQIKRTRNAAELLRNFPPTLLDLWDKTRRVWFIYDDETADSANGAAQNLREVFAAEVETMPFAEAKKSLKKQTPDALVFFAGGGLKNFFKDKSCGELSEKTLFVADEKTVWTTDETAKLSKIGGVLTIDEATTEFEKIGIKTWKSEKGADFQSFASALAQPLSLIINNQSDAPEKIETVAETSNLPVWLYWEGECPEWIKLCRQTITANAPNARLLTPETFNELWTTDRDINLDNLHVAHRADFIRAYLLKHYGGLWIDSDCVAVKSFQPLLEKIGTHDFAAHRERGGYFGNEFMFAKPESRIAAAFYERICRTLRSRRNFGWCDLGCVPLTDVINKTDADFAEIDCELIQPICWREVEPYFAAGDDREHESAFHREAFCYMLSNLTLQKYAAANPQKNLLAEDSFFSFLVRQALPQNAAKSFNNKGLKESSAAQNGSGNRWREVQFYLETMAKLSPKKVLDLEVGFGRWAILLRDLFENSSERKDWQISIEAVTETANGKRETLAAIYDRVRVGGLETLAERQDLTILGDFYKRASNGNSRRILEKTLDFSDYVLLSFGSENAEPHEYLSAHSEQIAARSYDGKSGRTALLLSKNDPRKLCVRHEMKEIFDRAAENCRAVRFESVSGPGSSLAQTAEIRRRLPILFADLDINSMLDAPCGDFNWLRHVDLRLERYVGADIVPSIVEQNRAKYENPARRFLTLDITNDFLPQCDLIFSRDCLVHLSFAEIFAALRNFCQSGAKYLLTTHFPNTQTNADIQTGDWRTLNFTLPPFNFPAPHRLINERCTENNGKYADKSLGLWRIAEIEKFLG